MASEEPSELRQHLVDEASKFLVNPNVASHADDNKKAFLKKKGLSEEEIKAAFAKALTVVPVGGGKSGPLAVPGVPYGPLVPAYPVGLPPVPIWVKVRDICNFVMILTGASYGLFYLYKRYLAPMLTGRREKTVEESMIELQQSVVSVLKEVQTTLASLEQTLSVQSTRIQTLNNKELSPKQLDEIKTELTSLKGLLINRRTFPSTPSMSPSIPTWQRKPSEKPVETPPNLPATLSDEVSDPKVEPEEVASNDADSTDKIVAEYVLPSEAGDSENGFSREDSFSLASAENGGSGESLASADNGGSAESLPDSEEEMQQTNGNVVEAVK